MADDAGDASRRFAEWAPGRSHIVTCDGGEREDRANEWIRGRAGRGALVLSACGSDNNTAATTSAAATSTTGSTAGSGAPSGDTTFEGAGFACATCDLRSSGSTAQGKVMERWIADHNSKCGGNLNAYGAVELTAEPAGKAVAAATVSGTGSDLSLKLDARAVSPSPPPAR